MKSKKLFPDIFILSQQSHFIKEKHSTLRKNELLFNVPSQKVIHWSYKMELKDITGVY